MSFDERIEKQQEEIDCGIFEQYFPSLKKYLHPQDHTVHAQQISENCLDKAKVRKVIDNMFDAYQGDKSGLVHFVAYLKLELGL